MAGCVEDETKCDCNNTVEDYDENDIGECKCNGSNENGGVSNENGGGSIENGGGSSECNYLGDDCKYNNGNNSNECICPEPQPSQPPQLENNPCVKNGHVPYWRHETDCDKFWQCIEEKKVLGTCSEGLQFNEHTHTCDFACNVVCVRKEIQSTAQADGLKLFIPWDKVDDLEHLSKIHIDIARTKNKQ